MTEAGEKIKKLLDAGFTKAVMVNKSYQVVATSGQDAAPSAWNDSQGVMVNENQELANDWSKVNSFCFFKKKFHVVKCSAVHVVGSKGNIIVVGREFSDVWYICEGVKKGGGIVKKAKKGGDKGKFAGPPDAYTKACRALFDELEADED